MRCFFLVTFTQISFPQGSSLYCNYLVKAPVLSHKDIHFRGNIVALWGESRPQPSAINSKKPGEVERLSEKDLKENITREKTQAFQINRCVSRLSCYVLFQIEMLYVLDQNF